MKNLFLLLIVIAATYSVQAQQPCLKLTKVKLKDQLHRGGTAEVKLTFQAKGCSVLTQSESLGGHVATLDVETAPEGVTTKIERVEAFQLPRTALDTDPPKADEISTTILLDASFQAQRGDFKLPGTLHYVTVDKAGTAKPESLAFSFPFQITPWQQRPAEKDAFVEGLKKVGIVAGVIVLAPLWIVSMWVACLFTGECSSC